MTKTASHQWAKFLADPFIYISYYKKVIKDLVKKTTETLYNVGG